MFAPALGLCSPSLPATALAPHPCRCCCSEQQAKLCQHLKGKPLLLLGGAGRQEGQKPWRWEGSRNPWEQFGPGLSQPVAGGSPCSQGTPLPTLWDLAHLPAPLPSMSSPSPWHFILLRSLVAHRREVTVLAVTSGMGEGKASAWTLPCHVLCSLPCVLCPAGFHPPAAALSRCLCTLPGARRAPRQLFVSLRMDTSLSHAQQRDWCWTGNRQGMTRAHPCLCLTVPAQPHTPSSGAVIKIQSRDLDADRGTGPHLHPKLSLCCPAEMERAGAVSRFFPGDTDLASSLTEILHRWREREGTGNIPPVLCLGSSRGCLAVVLRRSRAGTSLALACPQFWRVSASGCHHCPEVPPADRAVL